MNLCLRLTLLLPVRRESTLDVRGICMEEHVSKRFGVVVVNEHNERANTAWRGFKTGLQRLARHDSLCNVRGIIL